MKKKNNILTIGIIAIICIIAILITYNLNNGEYGLKTITYKEITAKQTNEEDFVLIISRSNCSHCATYKPKIQKIAEEYKLIVYYIDIDTISNTQEFLDEFNLNGSTPITLFFKSGKETSVLNRIEGDLSTSTVIKSFEKMGFIKR